MQPNTWMPMFHAAVNQKKWKPPSTDAVKKRRHEQRAKLILELLAQGGKYRNEIADALGISPSTIYKDLVQLEDDEKIESRKRGQFDWWTLTEAARGS